jgi:hypothetical protein
MRPFDISAVVDQLSLLQRAMGVTESVELPPEELTTAGIPVELSEVKPDVTGVLRYKGEAVVLYIHEQNSLSDWATSSAHKFHILDCATLKGMRTQGLGHRYVVTNRDDGTFPVRTRTGRVRFIDIRLCGNCNNALASSRADFFPRSGVPYFDIRAFFQTFKNVRTWPPELVPVENASRPSTPARPAVSSSSPNPPSTSTPPVSPAEPTPQQNPSPVGPGPRWADPIYSWPDWSLAIDDLPMRAALVQIERHGLLTEAELVQMVGDARRARRFANSYEGWLKEAPFSVTISTVNGAKSYLRQKR